MKKMLLMLVMVVIGMCSAVSASISIIDCAGLQNMNNDLNGDYVLDNNIACDVSPYNEGSGFEPIGDSTTKFTGSFEGNDYNITGLYINRSRDYVGLFGYTSSTANIRNVGLEGGSVTGDDWNGGLIGKNEGEVYNSHYTGDVIGMDNNHHGGLIGENIGTVTNSYATGTVTGNIGNSCLTGGLIGSNAGTVSNSYTTGKVNGGGCMSDGGLIGYNSGGYVTNCYSTGDVDGGFSGTGGLIGQTAEGTIEYSYTIGAVLSTGGMDGGFIGWYMSGSNTANFWRTDAPGQAVTSDTNLGDIDEISGETGANLTNQSTFTDQGWDFVRTWGINPSINGGYPYLLLLPPLPIYSEFETSEDTTNFTLIMDTTAVAAPVLSNDYAMVEWFGSEYDVAGKDLDAAIEFGDKFVSINSSAVQTLNTTANVTISNVDCSDQRIYQATGTYSTADAIIAEDTLCTSCVIYSCIDGTLKFSVPHFTGYAVGSNSNLTIYDEYENSSVVVGSDITFYANYTNKISGAHIGGADCQIEFDDAPGTTFAMTDNGNNYDYTKSLGFSTVALHEWNVTCSNATGGWNTLNATDDILIDGITSPPVPEFSMLTLGLGLIVVLAGLVVIRRKK